MSAASTVSLCSTPLFILHVPYNQRLHSRCPLLLTESFILHNIDIIICEDDPYYFLQLGEYVPKSIRKHQAGHSDADQDDAHFLAALSPSYLRSVFSPILTRYMNFSYIAHLSHCLPDLSESTLKAASFVSTPSPRRSHPVPVSVGSPATQCLRRDSRDRARRARSRRAA